MYESLALGTFILRMFFHLGMIVMICRYDDKKARYRPGVGLMATLIAGVSACQIFVGMRHFWQNNLAASFEPFATIGAGLLFLVVIQTGGNVAIFLRPIQSLFTKVTYVKH